MMNEHYWKEFYSHRHTLTPSPFALWARQWIHQRTVYDLGCGNGRDTEYLRGDDNHVVGVDQFAPDRDGYCCAEIGEFIRQHPPVPLVRPAVIYCRFLLHAIEPRLQQNILHWARRFGATIYIEARSVLDKPLPGHRRRLIDGQRLVVKMVESGWRVMHYEEGYGRACFGDEDPHVFRLVAKGNGRK
jgi:hypothetical protein